MSYKIIWSKLAIQKIKNIIDYISIDNPVNAKIFAQNLFVKTDRLSEFPKSGRIVPELNQEKLREIIYSNYRIIYRIENQNIHILTVRNSREFINFE